MVKADVRRDYYAELGLGPSAEADDIKKQFRRLALKCHPDRNPGKEQEFNAKFQAIQAAHEILSDPQQRLKYDTDRLRAGYGKVYGPPKSAPQRKPPPPTAAPKPQKPKAPPYSSAWTPNGASTGAQRYSAHARAGPQQWKTQDEAQTRADAFKGFSGMRGSNPSSKWQSFDPQTGRATPTPGTTPRQQNAPFGGDRDLPPGTPGGDEPPAANTSAYTSTRSDRPSSMYFESAPPPTAKKPTAPEPGRYGDDFERASSRYAATGGEKTFFSSAGLGRSSTMRTPSGSYRASNSKTTPPSPVYAESGRHRSASPKVRRRPDISPASSTSSSEPDTDDEILRSNSSQPKPKAVPKSRLRPHQKFSDFYRGDDSSSGTGKSSCTHSERQSFGLAPTLPQMNFRTRPVLRGFEDLVSDTDDDYEYQGHNSDSAAFTRGSNRPQQPDQHQGFSTRNDEERQTFERRSSSDLNGLHKKFSAEDWREHFEKFDFMGAAAKEKEALRRSRQNRASAQPHNGSAESMGSGGSSGSNRAGSSSSSTPQQPPTQFAQAKFSADQWSEQLRSMSWNIPDTDQNRQPTNPPPSRSPKRPTRPASKLRSTPQQPSVTAEVDEEHHTVDGHGQSQSPHAPPNEPNQHSMQKRWILTKTSLSCLAQWRLVPTPSRQAQNRSRQLNPTPSRSQRVTPPTFDFDNIRKTAPFTNTNNGGIDDLADMQTHLPFESRARRNTTSQIRPRKLDVPNPPKRPKAPSPVLSQPGSNIFVLPRDKWQYYVSAMSAYMHEWNKFNQRMLLHFNTRQEANETGLSPGWISAVGDSTRLHINGEDDTDTDRSGVQDADPGESDELVPNVPKGGFSAYLRGIEEDNQVRKHWEVACEGHRDCIMDLGRLREWIRNGGKVV
ncbi:hypothetical protein N7468_007555 [Penicillium chermesinum]|uniref:J domain-containing protein n=1 Tax=Penicillium chermesinum TaxID=63820 RepID=A0A9W9NUJ5_9EURO|nr:uncharacterized protein N7468_007555 [Penicillium chermesinum]KAJ5226330.1 hypothetical protein N7468_007555 [Penicillium chermesinum]